jgi:hypothetical protein
MPLLEREISQSGSSEVLNLKINHYPVIVEKSDQAVKLFIDPDVSIQQAVADIAPVLGQASLEQVVLEQTDSGYNQPNSTAEFVNSMAFFYAKDEAISFMHLFFSKGQFLWWNREAIFRQPNLGLKLERFDAQVIDKFLCLGNMTIIGSRQVILDQTQQLLNT